jgi:hypothetical protein
MRLRYPLENAARGVSFLLEFGEQSIDHLHRSLLYR